MLTSAWGPHAAAPVSTTLTGVGSRLVEASTQPSRSRPSLSLVLLSQTQGHFHRAGTRFYTRFFHCSICLVLLLKTETFPKNFCFHQLKRPVPHSAWSAPHLTWQEARSRPVILYSLHMVTPGPEHGHLRTPPSSLQAPWHLGAASPGICCAPALLHL